MSNSSVFLHLAVVALILATGATATSRLVLESDPPAAENGTHIQFFFQEIVSGSNQTSYVVAGLNRSSSTFGNIIVQDNILRDGPDESSKVIGRGQGLTAVVSEDGALLEEINFVFTDGQYQNSSLAMYGTILPTVDAEMTIVGGSGQFRMARGYVLRKLVSYSATSYLVQFDIYLVDY